MKYILPSPNKSIEEFIKEVDDKAEFDYLVQTPSENGKIYKKDIEFDYLRLLDEEPWIVVGAEVLKHIFRASGITKLSGTYQRFDSKEADSSIKVGCLVDPKIVFTYPEKEIEITKAILSLKNNKNVPGEGLDIEIYPNVEDLETFPELDRIFASDIIAYDLETSHLNPHRGEILGAVIAPSEKLSAYIRWTPKNVEILRERLKGKTLIGHNYKFDFKWSLHHGLDLSDNKFHDTAILAYLSGKEKEIGLKPLALRYTPFGYYDQELEKEKKKYCKIYKCKVGDFTYDLLPPEVLGQYACYDGLATHYLYTNTFGELQTTFAKPYKILREATIEVAYMELNGAPIDVDYLTNLEAEYREKVENLGKKLFSEIATLKGTTLDELEFNINSPAQLRTLLFNDMGLTPIKETDSGQPSTDSETLEKLAETTDNPLFKNLLDYRKASKFYNTYILNFKENLDYDNHVRTSFNLLTTASGRLSSGKDKNEASMSSKTLNFQNIPARQKAIKKLITARPGYVILNQDLKNAELWLVGVLANEESILNAFRNGEDIHSSTAVDVFGLDCTPEEVKDKYPDHRQYAKTVNFAILYLAGPGRIASELGISYRKAKKLIEKWFRARPKVKKWLDTSIANVRKTGEIHTCFGRYRYSPEVFSTVQYIKEHNVKSLINSLVQSPASDVNLIGFTKSMKEIRKYGLEANPIALVHDSIVLEIKKEHLEEVKEIIKRNIQWVMPADPPIGVDVEVGPNWGEVKEVK